ncbi:MAG: helix-turn-helix domain-containing protein [Candidatus Bathyarchaeota archaeon]|nr:MAG: helix-turn-helix domain-containing protein [Candidatus Bathyarchaeota archaeon]
MEQPKDDPYNVTIEIKNEQCKGLRALERAGIEKYALVDIRGEPKGPTRHLMRAPPEGFSKFPKQFFEKHITEAEETKTAWFSTDGCDICRAILSNSSFLISAKHVKDYTFVYNFIAPNFEAYRSIISSFEDRNIEFRIMKIGRFNPRRDALTDKQERVLWIALKMGFFDYPRKLTMQQLSKRLGMGLSSLSEILRRGTRRLLEDFFKS